MKGDARAKIINNLIYSHEFFELHHFKVVNDVFLEKLIHVFRKFCG